MTVENNPTWKAGYAAGWAAYGDLMIEQLGPDGMVWRLIDENTPRDRVIHVGRGGEACYAFCEPAKWSATHQWFVDLRDGDPLPETNDYGQLVWMPLPKPPMTSARKGEA